jgi:hypothetical protein
MKRPGSSKEPRETGCRWQSEDAEWRKSEKRKLERKVRKKAERRTEVDIEREVVDKTSLVGIGKSSQPTLAGTGRLV